MKLDRLTQGVGSVSGRSSAAPCNKPTLDAIVVSRYVMFRMTTRAVAYLRVSTDKQADHGVSIDAQRAKIAAYATLYDLDVVAEVVDAESAKTLAREGLQAALTMIATAKADALVIVKLDRLTRSVRDLGELVDTYFQRAALLSVSEQIDTRTSAGRLVLNVLASVAQWEREAIGERTSAAMAYKRSRGERVGAISYGYQLADDGVHLVEHAAEQEVMRAARELRARGLSLRAVADALAERGMVARNGRKFLPTQINRLMVAA